MKIREVSDTSQMLIVTHNKKTMELAQRLYGVTMQEPGVSSIVSTELEERPRAASSDADWIPPAAEPVAALPSARNA